MRSEHVDNDGRTIVRDADGDVRETVVLSDKDLREAYDRGRRDEAVRHKRNWLLTLVTALLALVGALVLVLAALNGSFQRGGAVIDRQLSIAVEQAEPTIRNAAGEVGDEIRDARADNDAAPATTDSTVVQTPAGQTTTTTTTAPEAR
jgi:hypothetical protein